MRPIGKRESQVTAVAVRLSRLPSNELLQIVERGSGASQIERKAAKRILRIRDTVIMPVGTPGRVDMVVDRAIFPK